MITIDQIKKTLSEHKEELKQNYQVKDIGIFGSYVRGEQKKKSDVDILVDFEESSELSLLDFIGLENYLTDLLGVKVDLVEKGTLSQIWKACFRRSCKRMTKEFIDYIEDIIKAIDDALSFVKNMDYEVFVKHSRTSYALSEL